jgi:chromosome segregation ATPase
MTAKEHVMTLSELEALVARWRDGFRYDDGSMAHAANGCADELEAALRQQASAPVASAQGDLAATMGEYESRIAHKAGVEASKRYAEQIRNLEKRAQKAEDQAGKARCERDDATYMLTRALPSLESVARDLENIHGIRDKAQAMNVAGYLRERIAGRAGTKPTTPAGVALQGRTHQLEEQREALETALAAAERDLAAERAAHEAANDELIAMLGRAERAEKRAAELERERDEAQNGYDDHANLCRTLTTERDSLRAELAKVREESVGKRLLEVTVRERNEARAELAACRAKLEGLREACALSEAEASYLSTYISCDHDSPVAVIKRIQSALQATQAEKPAIAAELAACKAKLEEMRREARAFECAAQLTDEECARLEDDDGNASDVLAALQERLTFAQARLRVSSHAIHPEPASAEKPDLPPRVTQRDVDVLATMADDSVNMTAQLEDIRKRFGMMSDVDAVTVRVDELELSAQQAFERIGRLEAASAEKPSLEERVGRHEQALRHILDALGKLTTEHGDSVTTVYGDTSLADAREALDGAGNGGG